MKSISQILKFLYINHPDSIDESIIHNLYIDSRVCCSESVFVALKGQSTAGNKYIESVLSNGCKLVITDKESFSNSQNIIYVSNLKDKLPTIAKWFYDYKKPKYVIGITGTNGKTSIAHNISQLLTLVGHNTLMLGTNGNGIYPDLKTSALTTLDTLSLYAMIATHNDADSLVMEVSSHSLDQNRAAGIDFDIGVFSNLSHDHLDYHVTMEEYFLAKAKLFQMESLNKAVINIDCEYGRRLCEISVAPVTTVSMADDSANVYINILAVDGLSTSFKLFINREMIGVYSTNLVGDFNLMNIGLTLACVTDMISKEEIALIEKISPIKGRMEVISLKNGAQVVIDFAHTPDALEKALHTLRQYTKQNLWCMFGCGGDRDSTKRAIMAKIAASYANKVVVTEDNNRFESFDRILCDIKIGFKKFDDYVVVESRKNAIKHCIDDSKDGDVILLAGKGHEMYIDKCGQKEFFDERVVVCNYIF
jgi:UDP-N-acetylmuramoyl-L-alanyl-D-glutamate--2,6-diaminopimelate ligase